MSNSAKIEITGLEKMFTKIDQLAVELRGDVMKKGIAAIGRRVAKRARELAPVGGPRVGVKAGKKHLQDTIGSKVVQYVSSKFAGFVLVVGPEFPAGAHGHLVEHGHRMSGFIRKPGIVKGKPFLRSAKEDIEPEMPGIIESVMKEAIDKALSGG